MALWWVEFSAGDSVSDVRPNRYPAMAALVPSSQVAATIDIYLHLEGATRCAVFGFSGRAEVCATSEDKCLRALLSCVCSYRLGDNSLFVVVVSCSVGLACRLRLHGTWQLVGFCARNEGPVRAWLVRISGLSCQPCAELDQPRRVCCSVFLRNRQTPRRAWQCLVGRYEASTLRKAILELEMRQRGCWKCAVQL